MSNNCATQFQCAGRWHRRVFILAWPVMLANMLLPLAGAVDTAVMGHLADPVYIGAVGIGAVVFHFLYWAFSFLRMGTTGFVAQSFGAGDYGAVHDVYARSMLVALVAGMGLIALQAPIGNLAFMAMDGSGAVEVLARQYYDIRIWAAPAGLINFTVLGFLFGMQKMGMAFVVQVVLNGMNIVLDLLFVTRFDLGVEGVAYATLISEYSAALLGGYLVHRMLLRHGTRTRWRMLVDAKSLRVLLAVNGNIMIRTMCLSMVFFYFTRTGAGLGDMVLAANTVLMHLFMFLSFGLDGFAHAVEALGGHAFGSRNKAHFRAAVVSSTLLAGVTATAFALFYLLAGQWLIGLFTNIVEVQMLAQTFLVWMIIMPLVAVWSFLLDGVFIGVTRSVEMRNGMLLSVAIYFISVLVLVPLWGNHGLWAAMCFFMVVRALTLWLWYPRIERQIDHLSLKAIKA